MNKRAREKRFHEAGHAGAARVQGIECLCVAMFSLDEASEAAAQTGSAAYQARDADQATQLAAIAKDIIICLAGPCAQAKHKHRKLKSKLPYEWKSGYQNAQTLAIQAALIASGTDTRSLARIPMAPLT